MLSLLLNRLPLPQLLLLSPSWELVSRHLCVKDPAVLLYPLSSMVTIRVLFNADNDSQQRITEEEEGKNMTLVPAQAARCDVNCLCAGGFERDSDLEVTPRIRS